LVKRAWTPREDDEFGTEQVAFNPTKTINFAFM